MLKVLIIIISCVIGPLILVYTFKLLGIIINFIVELIETLNKKHRINKQIKRLRKQYTMIDYDILNSYLKKKESQIFNVQKKIDSINRHEIKKEYHEFEKYIKEGKVSMCQKIENK